MNKIFIIAAITAILIGPMVMHDTARQAYAMLSVQLIPNSGTSGQMISYTVSGAAPSNAYTLSLNGEFLASGTTNPMGVASGNFAVPADATGLVSLTYQGTMAAGGTDKIGVPFTVVGTSGTASVQSTVTIAGTCGISVISGSLQYGTLIPGAISPEQTLTLQNTGTAPAALFVSGTDWLDGTAASVNQIDVGNTKWSTTAGTAFAGKTALTASPGMLTGAFDITPATLPTYWQLQANLNHGTFIGSLTQTVLLSVSC